jgi:hypothetical protein
VTVYTHFDVHHFRAIGASSDTAYSSNGKSHCRVRSGQRRRSALTDKPRSPKHVWPNRFCSCAGSWPTAVRRKRHTAPISKSRSNNCRQRCGSLLLWIRWKIFAFAVPNSDPIAATVKDNEAETIALNWAVRFYGAQDVNIDRVELRTEPARFWLVRLASNFDQRT